jgi:hypothetical protein
VIERIFDIFKWKYQILLSLLEYSIDTQTCIILACIALYNWVRFIERDAADIFLESEVDLKKRTLDIQPAIEYPKRVITSKKMDAFQNDLAERMWADYKKYIQTHNSIGVKEAL